MYVQFTKIILHIYSFQRINQDILFGKQYWMKLQIHYNQDSYETQLRCVPLFMISNDFRIGYL